MTTMTTVQSFLAGKRLRVGNGMRGIGELVPEAILWRGRIHLIHVSHLKEVYLSLEELGEAIEKFCPEMADELWTAYGVTDEARPGPEKEESHDGNPPDGSAGGNAPVEF